MFVFFSFSRSLSVFLTLLSLGAFTGHVSGQEAKPNANPAQAGESIDSEIVRAKMKKWRDESHLRAALDDHTQLEFIETPLQDVVDFLEDRHRIQIELDAKVLDNVGIGTDTPVSKELRGISLRSALRLMLRDLDLTYVLQDEVVLITTTEEAEGQVSVRRIEVGDLIKEGTAREELVQAVRVAAGLEADQIAPLGDQFVVRATQADFQEIEAFLLDLRGGRTVARMKKRQHPLTRWPVGENVDLSQLVSDADLTFLKDQKQIRMLDVSGSYISDKGVAILGELSDLEVLVLAKNHITDKSIAHLKRLKNLKELTSPALV